MFPHVIDAHHISGYRVRLGFDDELEGEIGLGADLKGPVFEPLKDAAEFARLSVDEKAGTIVWPNGADIAPEFLQTKLGNLVANAE